MEFNVDANLEPEFEQKFTKALKEQYREYIETEYQDGELECECGSQSFDIETWTNNNGDIMGAAVCRECNEKINLDVDFSVR